MQVKQNFIAIIKSQANDQNQLALSENQVLQTAPPTYNQSLNRENQQQIVNEPQTFVMQNTNLLSHQTQIAPTTFLPGVDKTYNWKVFFW